MRLYRIKIGQKGISIIAVVMIMTTLTVMGMAVTLFVATGAVSKVNELAREQSFALAQAGLEYALMQLNGDVNPNGHVRSLGTGQFTVQYEAGGLITINSTVNTMQGTASQSFSSTLQNPAPISSMGDCLVVDTSGANLSGGTVLQGITVRNRCTSAINISSMTNSWNPNSGERMTRIIIGGTTVYDNPGGVVSGTVANFSSQYAMSGACAAATAMSITFNSAMTNKNFTLVYTMSDTSSKSVSVQAISNEASCLVVNSSAADVGPPNNTNLINITLTNSCASDITINAMSLTWSPSAGRNVTTIKFDNNNRWTGSSSSPASITLSSSHTIAAGSPAVVQQITFASDIRGVNYSLIRYVMSDSTTQDTSVNLYETNMAACFSPNNTNAYIPIGTRTDIVGQTWTNTCPRRIMIGSESTNWTGLASGARVRSIVVDGVTAYSGNGARNARLYFSNYVTVNGGASRTVTRYRFDRNIPAGSTFTHTLWFFDATSAVIPSYTPPIR